MKKNMIDLQVKTQRAFVVGIYSQHVLEAQAEIKELASLAEADGLDVVGESLQCKKTPDPAYYIGQGKAEELVALVQEKSANLVIFDNELRSSQVRNLSALLKVRVIDRSELILDIFASRARSKKAKLQVEVASLQYEMSRLRRMWTHFGRIDGSVGSRGMGETQLEVDRRRTRERLHFLQNELREMLKKKQVEQGGREDVFKVALVGYTNAGKSTLLNSLTHAGVLAEDMLFATLDTTTRKWQLDDHYSCLISDTVGFVRKLPHHLVASFHATLSEVKDADILLHVVDVSHPEFVTHIRTVETTLEEIGCKGKNVVMVFNKTDCLSNYQTLDDYVEKHYGEDGSFVFVSAKHGVGLEKLKKKIVRVIKKDMVMTSVAIPFEEGKAMAFLKATAQVFSEKMIEGKYVFKIRIREDDLGRLKKML